MRSNAAVFCHLYIFPTVVWSMLISVAPRKVIFVVGFTVSNTFPLIRHHSHSRILSSCRFSSAALSQYSRGSCEWWREQIQDAYRSAETDGITQLILSSSSSSSSSSSCSSIDLPPAPNLWQAIKTASNDVRGPAVSIWNAMLATIPPTLAFDLFQVASEGNDALTVQPDVVTFSLLYANLVRNTNCNLKQQHAEVILDAARKSSRKMAGSARRKTLLALRQKQPKATSFRQAEVLLQEILGDEFIVLAETDDLVVINKPAGVCCFHTVKTNAGKIVSSNAKRKKSIHQRSTVNGSDVSLEDAMISIGLPLSTLNAQSFGMVHRLDRGTSGCLVMAKTDHAHALLVTDFFLRQTRKTYQCIVEGRQLPPDDETGSCLIDINVHNRPALSYYKVLERIGNTKARLQFETMTGRKHQVRIHCAQGLNCPIVGDVLYGTTSGKTSEHKRKDDQFFLHAATLQLPLLNNTVVEAPIPSWWAAALDT